MIKLNLYYKKYKIEKIIHFIQKAFIANLSQITLKFKVYFKIVLFRLCMCSIDIFLEKLIFNKKKSIFNYCLSIAKIDSVKLAILLHCIGNTIHAV